MDLWQPQHHEPGKHQSARHLKPANLQQLRRGLVHQLEILREVTSEITSSVNNLVDDLRAPGKQHQDRQ